MFQDNPERLRFFAGSVANLLELRPQKRDLEAFEPQASYPLVVDFMNQPSQKIWKMFVKQFQHRRDSRIFDLIKQKFPDQEEAWAIKHLICLRVLPVLDGNQGGGRKTSVERAEAVLRVVLNSREPVLQLPVRQEILKSNIINTEGLSTKEFFEACESSMKHAGFIDRDDVKLSAAFTEAMRKSKDEGRHSNLCSDLEWEILTRWRKDGVVARETRTLKIFADKLPSKPSVTNLKTTINRLKIPKTVTK